MYPRNAASPERIAIGAVVQISDGAVQTTGIDITVRGQGGSEGAGGGTTAVGASGIVYYTPTQAETNFTSFVVIASKTGCIPVAQTIVTTAASTAGQVVVGTNNDKTGYSLTATTGLGNQTANITGNVSGSVGSVTAAVTVGTISANVITASSIAASALDNKGNWNVGKTGYSLTQSFPSNFASMAITAGGAVTTGTNNDKTGYSLTATTGLGDQTANITGNLSGSVGSVTATTSANVVSVNGITVTGSGTASVPWGP